MRAGGRLRVAWDNSLVRRNATGTGVYAAQLTRELAKLPEVDLEFFEGWDPEERKQGEFGRRGFLARARRAASWAAWSHLYFPFRLRRDRFDVVHSPAFGIPFLCPCPSVVTVYDVLHRIYPDHFELRWRNFLNTVMPRTLRAASAVIVISEHTRTDLLRFYDVDPRKVHVVYCGIDHERFQAGRPLDQEWARGVGLRKGYVLHVGTFVHRKNIPFLVRVIRIMKSRGEFEKYQLVLAGPETPGVPGGEEVRRAVQDLQLQEDVVITGRLPDAVLPGLYSQAKLLAFPSLYEGFGLPLVEAMASGIPVVASNASSIPEIAGDASILLSPTDEEAWAAAIKDLLENPARARELSQKGQVRARQFSWKRAAEETLAIYRSIVSD